MRVLIHEIAEECNSLEVTQKTNTDIPEWIEEATPEEIYIHMLQKIISAPTRIHMLCVPRILLPLIDRKLNSENDRFPHVVGQGAEWEKGECTNEKYIQNMYMVCCVWHRCPYRKERTHEQRAGSR